jgi:tetratricopeptide (TPR) repeat protein
MVTRVVASQQRLIPVLLTDAEMPPLLASRVWVDFRQADGPAYEAKVRELVRALKGEKSGPPPRTGTLQPPPGSGFRPQGPLQRRLSISRIEVALLEDGASPITHQPQGIDHVTEQRLWELNRARQRRLPEGSPLHRAGQSGSEGTVDSPLHHHSLEAGAALTRVFLTGEAGQQLRTVVEEATRQGSSLELGLEVSDETLVHLPWETLRVPAADGAPGLPLALHPQIHFSRVVAGLGATPAVHIPGPLRILVVVGSPEKQNVRGELLDMERELARILDAVEPARKSGKAFVRVLETGSVKAMREALSTQRYHIVHISCHAAPGMLILENDDGEEDRVTAARLWQEALVPDHGVPLLVLAGCATALSGQQQGDEKDTTTHLPSLAQELLAHGVPAVVAMQAAVGDVYATTLCAELYHALATHHQTTPLAALSYARHQVEAARKRELELSKREDLGQWATPTLYLRGPSLPLYDATAPFEQIALPPEPRLAQGVIVRRVGDFVGRRHEQRVIRRALRDPERAGVLLHAIGGVGKSSLAAQVLQQLAAEGRLLVSVFGEVAPDTVLAEIGEQLWLYCMAKESDEEYQKSEEKHQKSDEERRWRRVAVELKRPDLTWQERFRFLAQIVFTTLDVIVLLDNFEDNLSEQQELKNDDLAALLALWASSPGRSQLFFTCRYPFRLPNDAQTRLESVHLGPLSLAETRKLVWRLDGLDALAPEELRRAYEEVGGHPRTLEYLDALLRGGKARFDDVEQRLKKALTQKGITDPGQWYRGTREQLDVALAEAVTFAADDILLDSLLASLANIPLASELLLGVSVYRVPVDEIGVTWQVGEEKEAPGNPQSIKIVIPRGTGIARKTLEDLGLLAPVQLNEGAKLYSVHRWTATALAKKAKDGSVLPRAHKRAACYWQWRIQTVGKAQQQHIGELLEARYHYHQAAQIDEAVAITQQVVSQLDTWGAWQWEEQLCRETLSWVPQRSIMAAFFLHQLGNVAQHKGAYDKALEWYSQSLVIRKELNDRAGIAVSLHNLGSIALHRGQHNEALERYQQSLAIRKELEDRAGMAASYHQLGMITQIRGGYDEALAWYSKSLSISEELGDRAGMAASYNQLGEVAQDRGTYDVAIQWYRKALVINEELGDRVNTAIAYHNLGRVAQAKGAYNDALEWHRKSLIIKEELGDRAGMAASYQNLGIVAQRCRAFDGALAWYSKAIAIVEELGDRAGMAACYHQLSRVALDRGIHDEALDWCRRSLTIREELGDRAGIAASYYQLGRITQEQGKLDGALTWFHKAIAIHEELGDRAGMAMSNGQIAVLLTSRGKIEEALPLSLQSWTTHVALQSRNVGTDLHWLRRQRELLGEVHFREIVRERLGEEGLAALLKGLESSDAEG